MKNSSNAMFGEFKLYFPITADKVVEYRETSRYELTIKLNNGDMVLYDDLDKSIRNLPRNTNSLTEAECRLEFGRRLRKIMYMQGVSQKELADSTNISPTMLSKYMNGSASPSFYVVDRIAKALDCSADTFRYIF